MKFKASHNQWFDASLPSPSSKNIKISKELIELIPQIDDQGTLRSSPSSFVVNFTAYYSPYRTDAFHIKARSSIMPQPYLASRCPEHPAQTIKPLEKKKDDPPSRVAFIPIQCQFKKSRNDPNSSVKIYPKMKGN